MTSPGTMRSYAADDLDQVLDVWHAASVVAHPFLPEEFLAAERVQVVEHWLPIAETSVHELDGQVVGFPALIGNEVGAIVVDPERQGRGIGQALMDHARASRPFLERDVFEANRIGRRFHDAYGFEISGSPVHEATGQTELRLRLG